MLNKEISSLYDEEYYKTPCYIVKKDDLLLKYKNEIGIKISEGKNRQVRKMCRAINHPVMNLRRKAMGKIVLKDVEVGEYRHLTKEEVDYALEVMREVIPMLQKYTRK